MTGKTSKRSYPRTISNKARQRIKLASLILLISVSLANHYMKDSRLNSNSDQENYDNKTFKVINVADGDTIFVDWPDNVAMRGRTRIRLIGLDTPELGKGDTKDRPYSREALAFVMKEIMGKEVTLKLEPGRQSSRDKYKRLLAYVYLNDDTMLNELLIEKGMGWPDTRHEHLYEDRFEKLYKIARTNKEGLWQLTDPQIPDFFNLQ